MPIMGIPSSSSLNSWSKPVSESMESEIVDNSSSSLDMFHQALHILHSSACPLHVKIIHVVLGRSATGELCEIEEIAAMGTPTVISTTRVPICTNVGRPVLAAANDAALQRVDKHKIEDSETPISATLFYFIVELMIMISFNHYIWAFIPLFMIRHKRPARHKTNKSKCWTNLH